MEPQQEQRSSFVVAIIQNKAKEVGIAALDLRGASFHLSQFIESSRSYQNTLTLLHYFNPSEVITSANHAVPNGMVGIPSVVERSVPQAKQVTLPRGCFDDTQGALAIQSLAANEATLVSLDIYQKEYYLCLAAAAAVIKWLGSEKSVVISKQSLQISFNRSCDHMNLDRLSVQNLEVMESRAPASTRPGMKETSLFGMLNTTRTVGGYHPNVFSACVQRMFDVLSACSYHRGVVHREVLMCKLKMLLRASLLQPLKDIETINTRLDCLDELTTNEKLFFGLSQLFQKFPKDLDRVLCQFCFKKNENAATTTTATKRTQAVVGSIILLKEALDLLPELSEVLQLARCPLLSNIRKSVSQSGLTVVRSRMHEVIDEEVLHSKAPFVARTQQCFAVRSGIDGFLDVARRTFCDTSEAIHAVAKGYREDLNLPNLKMPFNNRRGFYISIPAKDVQHSLLPKLFIQVKVQGKNILCSTNELESLNIRNREAAAECYMRTECCLEDLINTIRGENRHLTLLSESLSLLDMMVNAFAQMVLDKPNDSYTRPEFTENGPIAIEAGRHPMLEAIHPDDFVSNNTFLAEASNMMIVTGPNMSGKSTYLRQVALITILAHIGCYVPAKYASFRIVDRLFTRLGTNDDLDSNLSTFQAEMRETAFILQNTTSRSLILIDELGRATSTCDGLAIAWSCCEYLMSFRAYTIFATHMHRLEQLSVLYPCVKVCYFSVSVSGRHLNFKYTLREGRTDIPHYGLLIAESTGLPEGVLEEARRITACLDLRESTLEEIKPTLTTTRKEYHVAQRLLCLQYANNIDEDSIRTYLRSLKQKLLQD